MVKKHKNIKLLLQRLSMMKEYLRNIMYQHSATRGWSPSKTSLNRSLHTTPHTDLERVERGSFSETPSQSITASKLTPE